MDIGILRIDRVSTGIFGELNAEDESLSLYTLEHAYPVQSDGILSSTVFAPKIPVGTYTCVRGTHQLKPTPTHPNPTPFETFEITGVEGHTNLLFHVLNFNSESEGCIGLGLERDGCKDILHSGAAFEKFMEAQTGVNTFTLTIS